MSLNETHDALRRFTADIARFNETLAALERDLAEKHEQVDGLWRDDSRLLYDQTLAECRERLAAYCKSDAPRFEDFLRQKCLQLEAYLTGSGR